MNLIATSITVQPWNHYDAWEISLTRHDCHVYASMPFPNNILFTCSQLFKLHRQFSHPSAEKLNKLLKVIQPDPISPDTLKVLHNLEPRCEPCRKINKARAVFSFPWVHTMNSLMNACTLTSCTSKANLYCSCSKVALSEIPPNKRSTTLLPYHTLILWVAEKILKKLFFSEGVAYVVISFGVRLLTKCGGRVQFERHRAPRMKPISYAIFTHCRRILTNGTAKYFFVSINITENLINYVSFSWFTVSGRATVRFSCMYGFVVRCQPSAQCGHQYS